MNLSADAAETLAALPRRTYRIDETAASLGVCTTTVRNWIRSGRLRANKIDRTVLIPVSEIDRIVGESSSGSAA